jgi:arginase
VPFSYYLIGASSGWGAQIQSCELGPKTLLDKFHSPFPVSVVSPKKKAEEGPIPNASKLELIHQFNLELCHTVQKTLKQGSFPIVLGGDHSIAIGTWNAFSFPFGLIWIDAHMDSHTPDTSHSGAYHGMPLAALLGYGPKELSQFIRPVPVLKGDRICLIGVRSFEIEEYAFLQEIGVRIYFMEEVKARGLQVVLAEAIDHVTTTVPHFGISLDLDVFSPEEAPGVGSPEPNGLHGTDFLSLIPSFAKDERLIGFEMVEFNPTKDVDHKTEFLALNILKELTKS